MKDLQQAVKELQLGQQKRDETLLQSIRKSSETDTKRNNDSAAANVGNWKQEVI
jgi:hypothetical protein